ncbi:hypothetical protein F5Y10DRAFT_19846 [Nemania abortiva]|nr:hypothetical protein F5Y10DRAFT_19846 [Nemania abortiva]
MPRTKPDHENTSGVIRQTADGVYYANGRYLCRRLINGTPCNREIAGTTHSISSHNSDFHREGQYQRLQARGDYPCSYAGCGHQSPTFNAILGHNRSVHGFRGSSDPLKEHYGIPIHNKNKRKREDEVEKTVRKRQCQEAKDTIREDKHQDTKKDGSEDRRQEPKEGGRQNESQNPEGDNQGNSQEDLEIVNYKYNEFLDCIDPVLRKWDRDNNGFGDDDAGSGGSGLGGQILSSNVLAHGS